MSNNPHLYKYSWSNEFAPSYVVYRNSFNSHRCTLAAGIRAHKVALFVTEEEANNYCNYRNYMLTKYNSDDVTLITEYGTLNNTTCTEGLT